MKVVRNLADHVSRLIKAMEDLNDTITPYSDLPQGMFGRVAIIKSGDVSLSSEELDIEFTVPFDDDIEANEAEIIIYNLSKTTIQALKYDNEISIIAGYKGDTGVIFKGFISKVTTKTEGVDRVTIIKALDDVDLKERDLTEITYKKGTKASHILQDLIGKTKLPLAVCNPRRDHTYKDEVKIGGGLMENIRKYAEVCGISVYINQGKVYARHISEGENISFEISVDTGLIGSPEEFEEEITAEDYKDVVKGYEVEMILQHRMTTAVITKLTSHNVSGEFRVRAGEHIFNPDESITRVEVI